MWPIKGVHKWFDPSPLRRGVCGPLPLNLGELCDYLDSRIWQGWYWASFQAYTLRKWQLLLEWTLLERSHHQGLPGGTVVKNLPANAGDIRDVGAIPRWGRSHRVRNGNPFQYSCLEKSQRERSLAGCSPWSHEESDMTELLSTHMYRSWVGALESSAVGVSPSSQHPLSAMCMSHRDISPIDFLEKVSPRRLQNAISKRLQAKTGCSSQVKDVRGHNKLLFYVIIKTGNIVFSLSEFYS